MTETSGLERFLTAVEKLPPYEGVTFRGAAAVIETTTVAAGVMASSRDPRVASENFATPVLLALHHRTGRDISALAQHADEAEVVVLPGSVWRPITTVVVEGTTVQAVEELDVARTGRQPDSWGTTTADVEARVTRAVEVARARGPVPVHSPGKFAGAWVSRLPDA